MMKKSGPDKVFRVKAIEAAIWIDEPHSGVGNHRTEIRITRSYQDAGGSWRHTNRFGVDDLPKVQLVTCRAYEFLAMREFPPAAAANPRNASG